MNHRAEGNDTCCNARDIAWNAAESIRALNHLTQPASGQNLAPADIDQIVAALGQAADRLPQLLRQVGDLLHHRQQAGLLRIDQGLPMPDPATAVTEATSALRRAAGHASNAGHALDAAHQILAHLATSAGTRPILLDRGPGTGRSTTGHPEPQSPANHRGGEPVRRSAGPIRETRRCGGDLSR